MFSLLTSFFLWWSSTHIVWLTLSIFYCFFLGKGDLVSASYRGVNRWKALWNKVSLFTSEWNQRRKNEQHSLKEAPHIVKWSNLNLIQTFLCAPRYKLKHWKIRGRDINFPCHRILNLLKRNSRCRVDPIFSRLVLNSWLQSHLLLGYAGGDQNLLTRSV